EQPPASWGRRLRRTISRDFVKLPRPATLAERPSPSAGSGGCHRGERRGLSLERLLLALEGIAVGQLSGGEVSAMRPVGVLPDQHSQRQLDADAGVCLH